MCAPCLEEHRRIARASGIDAADEWVRCGTYYRLLIRGWRVSCDLDKVRALVNEDRRGGLQRERGAGEQRRLGYARSRDERVYPTAFDQINELTELRAALPWLADVPRNVCS